MSIPFARQHDKGTYQCGYQIAGEQQRIFVEGGVTVNFKGMYILYAPVCCHRFHNYHLSLIQSLIL